MALWPADFWASRRCFMASNTWFSTASIPRSLTNWLISSSDRPSSSWARASGLLMSLISLTRANPTHDGGLNMPDDEDVLDVADRLWRGEIAIEQAHPFAPPGAVTQVAEGCAFVPSFANVSAVATDDGLVLVDTGSQLFARNAIDELRRWSTDRVHTAVYSHGHVDHVFGVPLLEEEADAKGWAAPTLIAHEALPARFDRYILTAGYNEVINQRQFRVPNLRWPTEYCYPDRPYHDTLAVDIGGLRIALHHARG